MDLTGMLQAAAGSGGGGDKLYIESVFQTYLYTGNGSTQTITNGIDLAGEGGLVWIKKRGPTSTNHSLVDSERGVDNWLSCNTTDLEYSFSGNGLVPMVFNANGFTTSDYSTQSENTHTYASWTFRKAPKFFDCVTYTGNGVDGRVIAHNLGSVPGCIIVRRTDTTGDWYVYHRGLTSNREVKLNTTGAEGSFIGGSGFTTITDSGFNTDDSTINGSGGTYVAYLFAHDAGGFGDDGEQNVISCGSVTSADGVSINLGWEPQWILAKRTDASQNWFMFDTMRGWTYDGWTSLNPNLSSAESAYTGAAYWVPTATGINIVNSFFGAGVPVIYIAIRRGPMKTPTSGTEVFAPAFASSSGPYTATAGFPVDWAIYKDKGVTGDNYARSRLTDGSYLVTNSTAAEVTGAGAGFQSNTAFTSAVTGDFSSFINYLFRRAPGFFDVVCYTGTGVARTVAHNLGVAPEMVIVKKRTGSTTNWIVFHKDLTTTNDKYFVLNSTSGLLSGTREYWGSPSTGTPVMTDSVFGIGGRGEVNELGSNIIAYLFATLAGVSKVGSYTGTGTTLQVDCGFSAGARFVLIKRTDSTGDWYVWDSARGIVSGNDPYLLLNSTAAEVTSTDYIDPYSAGFEISSTAPAAINASGGTFIYFSVA